MNNNPQSRPRVSNKDFNKFYIHNTLRIKKNKLTYFQQSNNILSFEPEIYNSIDIFQYYNSKINEL